MQKQRGFGLVEIIVIIGLVAAVGGVVWWVIANNSKPKAAETASQGTGENGGITLRGGDALQRNQINTQVKTDVMVVASATVEYASNNAGSYPTSQEQFAALLEDGDTIRQPFTSPITKKAYVGIVSGEPAKGNIVLRNAICNDNSDGTIAATSARQFALLTVLADDKVYCTDL